MEVLILIKSINMTYATVKQISNVGIVNVIYLYVKITYALYIKNTEIRT